MKKIQGSASVRDNIATVFGSKFLHTLDPISIDLSKPVPADDASDAVEEEVEGRSDADQFAHVDAHGTMQLVGFVSKAGRNFDVVRCI